MTDDTNWLTDDEMAAWVRLEAVLELLLPALDSQLRRDSGLTHFEYYALAMLSEAPDRSLQMTTLAARTNATLPRLSHVMRRLQSRGLVTRSTSPTDGRATIAHLTADGWALVREAAPGHVSTVRHFVFDTLTPDQVGQVAQTADAMLERLDPTGRMTSAHNLPGIGRSAPDGPGGGH